jgi:hypothetical protein
MIETEWLKFKKQVMPLDASSIQVADMRNSFYAGSLSLFNMCKKISKLPEDQTIAMIHGLQEEFDSFLRNLHGN